MKQGDGKEGKCEQKWPSEDGYQRRRRGGVKAPGQGAGAMVGYTGLYTDRVSKWMQYGSRGLSGAKKRKVNIKRSRVRYN